jgi:hypothetical protein
MFQLTRIRIHLTAKHDFATDTEQVGEQAGTCFGYLHLGDGGEPLRYRVEGVGGLSAVLLFFSLQRSQIRLCG